MIKQLPNGLWCWGDETTFYPSYEECLAAHKAFHKVMSADVRPEGNRKFTFVLSSPSIDRDHDTVDQMGIDVRQFKKNPVVLWAHDYTIPPVARVESTWLRDGKLMGSVAFPPAGVHTFADTLCGLVEHGFLNAVSVGFTPVESVQRADGGMDYQKIELMELSLVPIPSNRDALIQAASKGVNVKPVTEWAEKIVGQEAQSATLEAIKRLEKNQADTSKALAEFSAGLTSIVKELKDFETENSFNGDKDLLDFHTSFDKLSEKLSALAEEVRVLREAKTAPPEDDPEEEPTAPPEDDPEEEPNPEEVIPSEAKSDESNEDEEFSEEQFKKMVQDAITNFTREAVSSASGRLV